jgi:hypothetical protein
MEDNVLVLNEMQERQTNDGVTELSNISPLSANLPPGFYCLSLEEKL